MSSEDFITLSKLLPNIRTRLPPEGENHVTRGLVAVADLYGYDALIETSALQNMGAMAAYTEHHLVTYFVQPSIAELVEETDLHSIPSEPPTLLRAPFLLEVRKPKKGQVLFGTTVSLGGYWHGDRLYLIALLSGGEALVVPWSPEWTGEELSASITDEGSPLIEGLKSYGEWALEASRYLVVLGLLLDAPSAPLVKSDSPGQKRSSVHKNKNKGDHDFALRYIYLDDTQKKGTSPSEGGSSSLNEKERSLLPVQVTGYLRRQRHGVGLSEVKWIYVASYEARRWVSPHIPKVLGRKS